ncbi:MAG: hypothetical protein WD830_12235 [Chloroflexota bacterium]
MAIEVVNFILTVVVLALGVLVYNRDRSMVALLIGIAFGIFAVSHLMELLNLTTQLATVIIVIRIIAYLLAIYALFRLWQQR